MWSLVLKESESVRPNLHSNADAEGAEVPKCRRRMSSQFSFGLALAVRQQVSVRCIVICDNRGCGTCTWDEGRAVFLSQILDKTPNTSSYRVRVYPSMSSSSLSHDEATHSASSATRFSVDDPSAGALAPTPSAHSQRPASNDHDPQHTINTSSEKYLPIVQPQTPSVTESGTDKIEREHAVEPVSPNGEHLKNSEDDKEAHPEKEDPFLVVWDKDDKENPRVCRIQFQDSCPF